MKPRRCSWSTSTTAALRSCKVLGSIQQQLQDHTERTGQTVRWWSCSIRCSESIWLLTLEGVRRVSHGSRSGAPSRRKAAAERGGQVSVENCCFFLAPLTDLSEVRSRAARQPSQRPQWAAAADGRCRPYGLISPPLYLARRSPCSPSKYTPNKYAQC